MISTWQTGKSVKTQLCFSVYWTQLIGGKIKHSVRFHKHPVLSCCTFTLLHSATWNNFTVNRWKADGHSLWLLYDEYLTSYRELKEKKKVCGNKWPTLLVHTGYVTKHCWVGAESVNYMLPHTHTHTDHLMMLRSHIQVWLTLRSAETLLC